MAHDPTKCVHKPNRFQCKEDREEGSEYCAGHQDKAPALAVAAPKEKASAEKMRGGGRPKRLRKEALPSSGEMGGVIEGIDLAIAGHEEKIARLQAARDILTRAE